MALVPNAGPAATLFFHILDDRYEFSDLNKISNVSTADMHEHYT